MEHLTTELNDAKSRTKLAEQQYVGLKDTIRILQEENDSVKKENRELETRFVTEKDKLSMEMNKLADVCDSLKRELDMLRGLKQQEEKRKTWFGLASTGSKSTAPEKVKVEDLEVREQPLEGGRPVDAVDVRERLQHLLVRRNDFELGE